jgi:predicted RNase H-like nuclease
LNGGRETLVGIGADGIAGGWIAAACWVDGWAWSKAFAARELPPAEDRRVELKRCDDVRDLVELRDGTEAIVAIDVPLGLLEHGGARPCDIEARRLLGKGASSVFNPPPRYLFPVLAKATSKERWQEAQRLVRDRRASHPREQILGVSQQTIGILDKVADADAYLRAHRDAQAWVIECHPEISFLRMNGDQPLAPKSKAKGILQRLHLIERQFPGTIDAMGEDDLAESVPLADLLDAYAALWTALRVACEVVHPERDALGRDPGGGRCPRADGLLLRIVA